MNIPKRNIWVIEFELNNGKCIYIDCDEDKKNEYLEWFNSNDDKTYLLDLSSNYNEGGLFICKGSVLKLRVSRDLDFPFFPLGMMRILLTESCFNLKGLLKGIISTVFVVTFYYFFYRGIDFTKGQYLMEYQNSIINTIKITLSLGILHFTLCDLFNMYLLKDRSVSEIVYAGSSDAILIPKILNISLFIAIFLVMILDRL